MAKVAVERFWNKANSIPTSNASNALSVSRALRTKSPQANRRKFESDDMARETTPENIFALPGSPITIYRIIGYAIRVDNRSNVSKLLAVSVKSNDLVRRQG
ncbi:hypothetical protein AJ80_01020 [Polytolypa hystricis UAMH7299]|uniref:Uncharacterized protein n=1 Tax=Polytolypa hystricis (strain UAMH7299) TaxID=1447883 RepID=A0A2B7Z1M9_POLH7|nr:hypothetical protein AJ80_01020 [Polytolypa hystricis UAMH7299]